eukprot:jgi/Ulvmu1/8863/UM049_0045.1
MIGADEQHPGQVPTNDGAMAHDSAAEDEMRHDDSDHDQMPGRDMYDYLDFPGPLMWGDDHDETDEEDEPEDDMESEEDDNMAQDDLGVLDADLPLHLQERQLRMWNLRGQLGVLPEFVRMLLPANGREPRTNEDLIKGLKRHSNITCKEVLKAFSVCSRDIFMPEDQKSEAFDDQPARLDRDYNISAPHMHACMIQGLQIQEGDHVLDIGSGCGATTAIMAYLTGKAGKVVGVELRAHALDLARSAMVAMNEKKEYRARACELTFEQGNAFILPHHEGLYDRVHVGGLCDASKLPALLKLLRPGSGRLVVPCSSELLCLTRTGSKIQREVLAHVRFGELETPSDVEIIFGHLEQHREARLAPSPEASRYAADMADALGGAMAEGGGGGLTAVDVVGRAVPRTAYDDAEELDVRSTCTCGSFGIASNRSLFGRSPTGRTSIGSYGSPPTPGMASAAAAPGTSPPDATPIPFAFATGALPPAAPALASALGPPDCTVRGAGFELPAHSAVLRARCPVTHAQFSSGMRDANARTVTLPPHFAEAPIRVALEYMYTDAAALNEDTALPTLAAAVYLNMSHLVALCSKYIIAHLRSQDVKDAVESAAQLHIFASEHGLDALCAFCASFLAVHISAARAAPSYRSLGAKQLDEVLAAVAAERDVVVARLEALSCGLAELGLDMSKRG